MKYIYLNYETKSFMTCLISSIRFVSVCYNANSWNTSYKEKLEKQLRTILILILIYSITEILATTLTEYTA